jgi:hypothetical protein
MPGRQRLSRHQEVAQQEPNAKEEAERQRVEQEREKRE